MNEKEYDMPESSSYGALVLKAYKQRTTFIYFDIYIQSYKTGMLVPSFYFLLSLFVRRQPLLDLLVLTYMEHSGQRGAEPKNGHFFFKSR